MKTAYKAIITIVLVSLLVCFLPTPSVQAAPPPVPAETGTSYIIVHALNPEGIEIASIERMGPYSVEIYDGDTLIGYSAHNEETHNQPIAITSGEHTIKVKFNGMVLEQEIDIAVNETKTLTFTFKREDFNIYDYIYSADLEAFQLNEGYTEDSHPTTQWKVSARVWYYPSPPQQDVWTHAKLYFSGGISYSWLYYLEIHSDSGGYCSARMRKSSGAIEIPIQRENFSSWFVQTVEYTEFLDVRIGRAYSEGSYPPSNAVRIWGDPGTTLVIGASTSNSAIWIGIDGHGDAHIGPSVISYVATDSGSGIFDIKFSSVPYDLTGTGIKHEDGAGENQPPIASFEYSPAFPVVGQEITFDGSWSFDPDGDPLTYKWDFGDGEISTKFNPTHIYKQAGTYEVELVVNDGQVDSFPFGPSVVVKEPEIIVWVEGAGKEGYLVTPSVAWWPFELEIVINVQILAWGQPIEGATILFDGIERGKTDADGHLRFLFPISAKEITHGPFIRTVEAHWDGIVAESEPTLIYEVEKANHKSVILWEPETIYYYNSMLLLQNLGISLPIPLVDRIASAYSFVLHWFKSGPPYLTTRLGDELEVTIYKLTAPGLAPAWLVTERVYRGREAIKAGDTWTGRESEYDKAVEKGLLDRRVLWFELHSPAVIHITAPDGSSAGYDPSTGELVADFPIAISEPGDEPFLLFIPQPLEGEYLLSIVGTGTGSYTLSIQALDSDGIAGPETTFTHTITEEEIHEYAVMVSESGDITVTKIPATVRIEPETLNLASQGVFTAFINLPESESYDVTDIDVSAVLCEGAPAVKGMVSEENNGTYIAKFNRQDLVNMPTGDVVTLTVTGKVHYNGGLVNFEGSDTIRVIDQGGGNNDNGRPADRSKK